MPNPEMGDSNAAYSATSAPAHQPVQRDRRGEFETNKIVSIITNEIKISAMKAALTPALPGCVTAYDTDGCLMAFGNNIATHKTPINPPRQFGIRHTSNVERAAHFSETEIRQRDRRVEVRARAFAPRRINQSGGGQAHEQSQDDSSCVVLHREAKPSAAAGELGIIRTRS